jgi:hypothetical protein
MGNSARQFTGWGIADAMLCCADPDLLSAWFDDRQAWQAAGSPSRFSFRSEYLDGYEAVRHNQSEGALRKISVRSDQSYARLKSSLTESLLAGRIVAWGRRETPTACPIAIPAPAWKYLHISDVRKSIVREKTPARTKIFDLRIFPIVESPDAINQLEAKTLVEAFQMSVVDDPELKALRKRAIAVGGKPASFGNEWRPYRAVWPVVLGQGPDIELAGEFDEPTKVKAANRIQRQRFARLISYLSVGRLAAEGVPAAGGMNVAIPPSIWQRDGVYIDLENGDLLEVNLRAKDLRPLFTGLILRKGEPIQRISELHLVEPHPAGDQKTRKGITNVVTKTTSRGACRKWLIDLMCVSPTVRPNPKAVYRREAQSTWPNSLSERAFNGAWDEAVAAAGAVAWSAGGRPKKPLQAKPPHQ